MGPLCTGQGLVSGRRLRPRGPLILLIFTGDVVVPFLYSVIVRGGGKGGIDFHAEADLADGRGQRGPSQVGFCLNSMLLKRVEMRGAKRVGEADRGAVDVHKWRFMSELGGGAVGRVRLSRCAPVRVSPVRVEVCGDFAVSRCGSLGLWVGGHSSRKVVECEPVGMNEISTKNQ